LKEATNSDCSRRNWSGRRSKRPASLADDR
jgi:hypothetical protein